MDEAARRIASATSYLESYKKSTSKNNNKEISELPAKHLQKSAMATQSIYDDVGSDYKISYDKESSSSKKSKSSATSYFDEKLYDLKARRESQLKQEQKPPESKLSKLKTMSEATGYDECYPDFVEISVEKSTKKNLPDKKSDNKRKPTSYFDNEWKKIQKIIEK